MLVMKELDDTYQKNLLENLKVYDTLKTNTNNNKKISYGYFEDDKLIAGIKASIEGYKVMYIETLFVDENYRKHGLGKMLMKIIEEHAKFEGVLVIRLDTFSWQAKDYYESLGYELIGTYLIDENYSEYFYVKRI